MKNLSDMKINQLRTNARSIVRELGLLNDSYFGVDVTVAERHLLLELAAISEPTMGELAERLLLDKSTISRLIARTLKKGYVKTVIDEQDKRRRFVLITKKGTQVLTTFEPIAFEQTKQALLTLQADEVEAVYKGIAGYAKGLRSCRLQLAAATTNSQPQKIESLQEIMTQLQQKGCTLELYNQSHEEEFYKIFKQVVDTGVQFPYESSSMQSFRAEFIRYPKSVYVCRYGDKVIGGFYLRANYSGRCDHIINAAYMMLDTHRGQGIGNLIINASLHIAKNLGFKAMQFNMVLSQNIRAIKLYERLGFQIVGTIPSAVRNIDGSFQDGYIMYRDLN